MHQRGKAARRLDAGLPWIAGEWVASLGSVRLRFVLAPEAFDCVVAAVQLHRINAVMPLLAS